MPWKLQIENIFSNSFSTITQELLLKSSLMTMSVETNITAEEKMSYIEKQSSGGVLL